MLLIFRGIYAKLQLRNNLERRSHYAYVRAGKAVAKQTEQGMSMQVLRICFTGGCSLVRFIFLHSVLDGGRCIVRCSVVCGYQIIKAPCISAKEGVLDEKKIIMFYYEKTSSHFNLNIHRIFIYIQ